MDVLNVAIRKETGTTAMKRLRRDGRLPAVLYGHGEGNVILSVAADEFNAAIRHGSKVVNLEGDLKESALIRDVQWDPLGVTPLHCDLTRVKAGESVEIALAFELRGDAPGAHEGGIVELLVHEAEFECPADSIPENIEINVNELHINSVIKLSDIELPAGLKPLDDLEMIVVTCHEPEAEAEEEIGAEGAEPEIIGRKEEEEEEE